MNLHILPVAYIRAKWNHVFVSTLALAISVFALSLVASNEQIHACECVESNSPTERLNEASAVFLGRVVKMHFEDWPFDIDSTAVPPEEPLTVEFNVHTVWKGEVSKVTHLTTARSEPCGFPFNMFQDYLVYADGKVGSLEVRACSRTQPALDAEEDLATFGEGYPPGPGSRGVVRPATLDCYAPSESAFASLDTWPLMLIAGVVWVGLRKRRRR